MRVSIANGRTSPDLMEQNGDFPNLIRKCPGRVDNRWVNGEKWLRRWSEPIDLSPKRKREMPPLVPKLSLGTSGGFALRAQ